jgi:L-threonylcarbamoyladenylate synthase
MNKEEIQKAVNTLKGGKIILYPTDTIWGLGCDATHAEAISRIYALKEREDSKSMIILVSDIAMLNRYVPEVPPPAWDIIELSEKPVTIIYEKVQGISPRAISENGSCAIRVCKDEFCARIIHNFGKPVISTSANKSGSPSPGNFSEISEEIIKGVDHVVDYRREETGQSVASSIILLKTNGEVQIIRK